MLLGQLLIVVCAALAQPAPSLLTPHLSKDLQKEKEKTQHLDAPPPVHPPKEALYGFGCRRPFACGNQVRIVDSNHRQDAENLREPLKPFPAALAQLDAYQSTRRAVRISAYVGTLGILVAVGGLIASSQMTNAQDRIVTRNVFTAAGAAITLGSTLITIALLNSNEGRLDQAVDIYNKQNPDRQIVLQFRGPLN